MPSGSRECPRSVRTWVACALLAFGGPCAFAVAPNLVSLTPAGGQRGTTIEVALKGERLADAQEIFFFDRGITLERFASTTATEVKARLTIAPDCRLGQHALRLRTASGISALRIFYVGPFPAVDEKEPNNDPGKPQRIASNTTIQGTLIAEDVDWFAVEAKQGQRLSLEIEAARLGRTMLDPIVTLLAPDGRQVARTDDTPLLGHDGYLSVIAPADGTYLIQVRDVAYAGNNHSYRLHVGDFPRPALALPLGGRPGETLSLKFAGDAAGEFEGTTTLPTMAARNRFGVAAENRGTAPSPNWLRVTDHPVASSTPAGSSPATAPLLDLPAPLAFHGVLAKPGEPAFFRFKGKKDQNLEFEVYARRLGSPLDSVLTVLGPKGNTLASNDDASGQPDSSVRTRLPEDADYTVKIADQLGRGGPLFAYRVEISPVRPTLTLSIPDPARYDNETRKSLVVPRGNRFAILLNVNRDSFSGDVRLAFDGLPAGISVQADVLPGSQSALPVVFEAAPDAALAGALLEPTARAAAAGPVTDLVSRFRHRVDWVRIQNDTVYTQSEVDRIAAAVTEEVPFRVNIIEPKAPFVQGGELPLRIVAERTAGFEEPITLKMIWNPPGVSTQPDLVIAKGQTETIYKLSAGARADTRAWKIAFIASATVKGGTAYVSTQLATVEVAAPFLTGKIALAKVERGRTGRVVCSLEQKKPFDGAAVARLVGLPDGVSAKEIEISKDSREAVFEVETSEQSPLGTFKNLSCQVDVKQSGESILHNVASGGVLRIDPPKADLAAAKTSD